MSQTILTKEDLRSVIFSAREQGSEVKIDPVFQYRLDQRAYGGGVLEFLDAQEYLIFRRAYRQSQKNCGKAVVGGGFNPSSEEEVEWVRHGYYRS